MKEKLSVLSELIKMARADAEVRETEYALMLRMAELLGVDRSRYDELFEEYIEFTPPASEFERITQFHRLVLVANIDLEVNSLEIQQLKAFGVKLGLRPEAIEKVLIEMKRHEMGMIPPDIMISIFQAYHN